MKQIIIALALSLWLLGTQNSGTTNEPLYDLVIQNGMIYDGSGTAPFHGGVAIEKGIIQKIYKGNIRFQAKQQIDARGLAVSPGFINMLSWANDTLLVDGRSQSDIRQGVTLEIFGEGLSMGPLNDAMKKEMVEQQVDLKFEVAWTKLSEYLNHLVKRGVSPNVGSFVGATTIRVNVMGYENRPPTEAELQKMKDLVAEAMSEGALGVGSALIYPPAAYAKTDELVALASVAAEHGGMYTSHIRGEGSSLMEAAQEFVEIAKRSKARSEIYHIKAAGKPNWNKFDSYIALLESQRKAGLPITANMYLYAASGTGLDAAIPVWVQEGGLESWIKRMKDPETRERVKKDMKEEWTKAGREPSKMLLTSFKSDALKPLIGKTLEQAARLRKKSPEETAMDLVIEDHSRVGVIYFSMSEENVKKAVALPWVSFGSDEGSYTTEGDFLKSNVHPRAYGNFARLLGRYVREQKIIPLQEAIRRLTSLPAGNLRLDKRGLLAKDYAADIAIFDPKTIIDNATYEKPHQYATGVVHVFVNGVQVLKNGRHTGATPGQVVRQADFSSNHREHGGHRVMIFNNFGCSVPSAFSVVN